MAGDTRTLTVSLVAEVASLKKGMKQAQSSLNGFQKSAQTTATVVKTAFAMFAGGFALAKMDQGIRSVISSFNETRGMIEDTKHLAEALGAGTEEVQAIRRAAEEAEIPIDTLHKNIRVLSRVLGLASMGTGPAVDALDHLGLSAQKLIHVPLHEQLAEIGEALSHVRTQAQRAAIVAGLFGKSGFDMLPFLEEAAPKIRELFNEMSATGELFTMEEAARVDDMGDAMARVYGVFQGLKQQLTIQFAPAIQYVSEQLQGWLKSMGGARDMAQSMIQSFISGGAVFADGLQKAYSAWFYIKGAALYVASVLVRIGGIVGSIFGGAMQGNFSQLANLFTMIAKTFKIGLLDSLSAFAKGVDVVVETLTGKRSKVYRELAAMRAVTQDEVDFARRNLTKGGYGGGVADSLGEQSYKAFADGGNVGKSWGDTFKNFVNSAMSTQLPDSSAAVMKSMIEDTYDILAPLEKQKALHEGITDQLEQQRELSKDAGSFTAIRQGEFAQTVGGVYGGGVASSPARATAMSAAASGAVSSSNTRTGADAVTGLLQGILAATTLTASNTGRPQLAVAG